MKPSLLFPAILAGVFIAIQTLAATDAAAGWQAELTAAQPAAQQNTGGCARAGAILRAVVDAARNGLAARGPAEPAPAGASLDAAVAQAAYSVLAILYPQSLPALDTRLAQSLAAVDDSPAAVAAGREWGEHVAQVILAGQDDAVLLNATRFAQAVTAPAAPSPIPGVQAEQAAIGPGRYHFRVLAGTSGANGYVDGNGPAARFDHPGDIAVDTAGNVYVSEETLGTIRKITPDGIVTTLAGTAGQSGSQDGAGATARFNQPLGVAVDGAGNVYVAEGANHTVRKIDPAGLVTTLAGTAGQAGDTDGAQAMARLSFPTCVAVDEAGNVLVADWGGVPRIRRISPDGTISTLKIAIPAHSFGSAWPVQLRVDRAGNIYAILDDGIDYADVVKFSPTGGGAYASTTLRPPFAGRYASGIGLDDAGNLYAKYGFDPVCMFTPGGEVVSRYVAGSTGGYWCRNMTVDGSGRLFTLPTTISAYRAATVEIGVFDSSAIGPVITGQPDDQVIEPGQSTRFIVSAAGAPTVAYQWYFNSSPIKGATGSFLDLGSVREGSVGFYSVDVSDGAGSVTSRSALLTLKSTAASDGSGIVVTGTGGSGVSSAAAAPATSGGGSIDAGLALAVLGLLAAAARSGGRTFNIAARGAHGMKEPNE